VLVLASAAAWYFVPREFQTGLRGAT
jgi:hypothetical protein